MIKELVFVASTSPAIFVYSGEGPKMILMTPDNNAVTCPAQFEEVTRIFEDLARQWRADTMFFSDTESICQDSNYKAIISLGTSVVPLMLDDLKGENPSHWFTALEQITGSNPVPVEIQGDVPAMAAAWIHWGKERGYTA